MGETHQLTLQAVFDLSEAALIGAGASALQAAAAARSIEGAEADGIRSVGLAYLPIYCAHVACGKVNGRAEPTWRQSRPAALIVDAANGFAHTAFEHALDPFADLAKRQGLAALAIIESSSAGVVAWFVERLAARNLIGLGFANSSPLMAPHGGSKPFFGTNPLAFAVPRPDQPALVVDQATSQVAYVTVKTAAENGEKIPLGWGLDRDGQPTTDPQAVLDGGSMAPSGGHKGMALALLVDVLAGGLAGPHFAYQASAFGNNDGGPPRVGQFFIAIDAGTFAPTDRLGADLASRIEALLAAMTEQEGVRIPGENRLAHRQHAAVHGVDVPVDLLSTIRGFADRQQAN